jgi:circadian clock protein KaiC
VGIHLKPHVESGVLGMVGARADARSADEHLLRIRAAIEEQEPRYLIIDPISAITKGGGPASALSVARQLIYHTKQEGITVLCTSLLPEPDPDIEATPLGISTLADNWIHVSYRAQRGERNRALTIVKARGTGHSSQVRELILSGDGLSLRDVYTAGGEVLMGTLRWEKEQEMAAERLRMRAEIEQRRQALSLAEAEAEARKQALEQEIEARRMELAALQEQAAREERRASQRAAIRREPGDGDSQQGPADQLEPEP